MHGHFRLRISWFLLTALIFGGISAPAAKPYEETQKTHSWFSFNRPSKKNPVDQLAHADALFEAGKMRKAGRAYKALAITWPGSPQVIPAQLRYARTLDARHKLEPAFDAYQALMEGNAGGFAYDEVLKRQFEIAQEIMNKRKGKLLIFGGFKAPEHAIPLFEKVVQNGPRAPFAPQAQYLIGQCNEFAEEYELAVVAYMTAQHRYPLSPYAEKAAFGRARALYTLSEESPNDADALEQALAGVVLFLNRYPDSEETELAKAYRDTLYTKRVRAAYNQALFYDKLTRKPVAALQAYRSFVKMYPRSEWAEVAQQRIDELAAHVEKTE